MSERFPKIRAEFPDFDLSTLPDIPEHWHESSWHNDACPSFIIGDDSGIGEGVQVFIDYLDPTLSEFPEERANGRITRFNAQRMSGDGVDMDLCSSDDWADMLAAVATFEKELSK